MDAAIVDAILLGVIQGIAEFLPVSSSGHLVLAQELLGINPTSDEATQSGLIMNVALHLGTLLSILVVYRKDVSSVAREFRIVAAIITATIPVVVVGLLAKDMLETAFSSPHVASLGLLVTAVVLVIGQRAEHATVKLEEMKLRQALLIGVFQMTAIVPGISRSGTTIAGGLTVGLGRSDAARFSFLIAIPAIGGAATLYVLEFLQGDMAGLGGDAVRAMLWGGLTAFVVGWFTLKWLLNLIAKGKLHYFSVYCGCAGILTLIWQFYMGL